MRILLLQSRDHPERLERERAHYTLALGDSAEFSFASLLDEGVVEETLRAFATCDALLLCGSDILSLDGGLSHDHAMRMRAHEALERSRSIIESARTAHKPIFGVCFGHQLVAEVYGGAVVSDPAQAKSGTFAVSLTAEGAEDPLFSFFAPQFSAQYMHKDSVTKLPTDAVVLANTPGCRFAALRYGTNVYTTQFHPELDYERMRSCLMRNPEYLPPEASVDSLVAPSLETDLLLRRWAARVSEKA